MITPRILFAVFLLLPLHVAAADRPPAKPSAAAKVKRPKSWDKLVAFVLAKGADRSIKSPLSTNLGYSEEVVSTKALRYKRGSAPDGREHAFHAVFSEADGKQSVREVVLTDAKITETDGAKHVEGYTFRLKPDGTPISAVFAKGISGDVVQTKVDVKSKDVAKALTSEKSLYTKTMAGKDFDE